MADFEGSPAKSKSRSASRSRSPSSRHGRSYSRSRSRSARSRSPSYKRSKSRSRSPRRRRRSSYRSRSRSYSPRRPSNGSRRGYYRSRSRSPMSERRRHQGNRENPEESSCIGVFGLSLRTEERDLRDSFEPFGPIEEVQIVYDRQTGRSRGFSFIYFKHTADSVDAKERMAGSDIDGHRIRVDYSITKRAHTPTPGIYLGKPTSRGRRRRSPSPYHRDSSNRRSRYSRSRSRSYDRY